MTKYLFQAECYCVIIRVILDIFTIKEIILHLNCVVSKELRRSYCGYENTRYQQISRELSI